MSECDVDDLMCQFQVMGHLEGMQKLLGTEKFQEGFPEFKGLEETIAERIQQQESTIKEALEKCGKPLPEEPAEIQEEVEP